MGKSEESAEHQEHPQADRSESSGGGEVDALAAELALAKQLLAGVLQDEGVRSMLKLTLESHRDAPYLIDDLFAKPVTFILQRWHVLFSGLVRAGERRNVEQFLLHAYQLLPFIGNWRGVAGRVSRFGRGPVVLPRVDLRELELALAGAEQRPARFQLVWPELVPVGFIMLTESRSAFRRTPERDYALALEQLRGFSEKPFDAASMLFSKVPELCKDLQGPLRSQKDEWTSAELKTADGVWRIERESPVAEWRRCWSFVIDDETADVSSSGERVAFWDLLVAGFGQFQGIRLVRLEPSEKPDVERPYGQRDEAEREAVFNHLVFLLSKWSEAS